MKILLAQRCMDEIRCTTSPHTNVHDHGPRSIFKLRGTLHHNNYKMAVLEMGSKGSGYPP